jgi:hypothetical protein
MLTLSSLNLNSMLSSSTSLKFFFNEIIFLDLLDRFFLLDYKSFVVSSSLLLRFNVSLPFSNSLLKFKNRVHLILYFLLFEILSGVTPTIVPVYKKTSKMLGSVLSKRSKRLQVLSSAHKLVDHFEFSAPLLNNNFFNLLLLLHLFVSKHSYSPLTVPSKYVKVSLSKTAKSPVGLIDLNCGTSLFEFFGNFDEILNSKLKIFFLLKIVAFNSSLYANPGFILSYLLQGLNFNILPFRNQDIVRLPLKF